MAKFVDYKTLKLISDKKLKAVKEKQTVKK